MTQSQLPTSGGEPRCSAGISRPPADQGISLDELGAAFARLIGSGHDPYEEPAAVSDETEPAAGPPSMPDAAHPRGDDADDPCPITPRSILEAMLFVGDPENRPLSSREVAGLMRGVSPEEIDDLVKELNAAYASQGRPYQILSLAHGYGMGLREEFHTLRDRFYGKVRQARLSQAAVECLAVVAYHQPIPREQVDRLRGKPSGSILAHLVRRQLVQLERTDTRPRQTLYRTTDRFLQVFGLGSLDDLPRGQELDRSA